MAEYKNVLTKSGLEEREAELEKLRQYLNIDLPQKIKEAREQGDLSENAEYDAARDEQRDVQAKILELEELLKNVEIVEEDEIELDHVSIGCLVRLFDPEFEEELEYSIVGSAQANALEGRISNESPVGNALIGHRVGDTVTVEAPSGPVEYHVLEIRRAV